MHPLTSRHDTNTSQWNRCHAAGDGPDPQDDVFANFQPLDEHERNLYAIEKELMDHRVIVNSRVFAPFFDW